MRDPAVLFRKRGIQVTAQRLAVFRAVAREPHIAADRVAAVVRAQIGAISLQSVYDALAVLVEAGLIRRIQPAGSPARFEDRVGDNHHHLICRTCSLMVDVACVTGSAPCLQPADGRGYEIDEAEVTYWGRCPDCAALARTGAAPRGQTRSEVRRQLNVRDKARTIPSTKRSPQADTQAANSGQERTPSQWKKTKRPPLQAGRQARGRTATGGRTS